MPKTPNNDRIDDLNGRLDDMYSRMNEGFARVEARMDSQLRAVNRRVDAVYQTIVSTVLAFLGALVLVGIIAAALVAAHHH